MFTRTLEVTPKWGKARELANTINERVPPILKKQLSDAEPNQILALSFWNTEDAERYQREQYPAIQEMIRRLLEAEPVVRTFKVDSSTAHRTLRKKPLKDLVDSRFSGETQHGWAPGPARACSYPKRRDLE